MTDFDGAMSALGRAIREAEALDDTLLPTSDLARWVWAVRGAVKRLRIVDGEASHSLASLLDYATPTLIDGVVWEAYRSSQRKEWDNDAVRRLVMTHARFDNDGEQRSTDDALGVIAKLYPLGGNTLRTKAARELMPGFDPDEYAHTERKLTVKATEATREENPDGEHP